MKNRLPGCGGPDHGARVMGGAGACSNIAALDATMATELSQNNVDGPGNNTANNIVKVL